MTDLTMIPQRVDKGGSAAADKLLLRIYEELRKLVAMTITRRQPGRTLQSLDVDRIARELKTHSRFLYFGDFGQQSGMRLLERGRKPPRLTRGVLPYQELVR